MVKDNVKRDLLTGEEFIATRVNQTFATPANRIKFYNSQANELRKETAVINIPISKTHRLIRKLMGNKREAVFSYDYLKGYGVNLSVFNHFVVISGMKYPAIFEFVIILLDENSVKIIRHDRY
jgi:hypothetical protein